MSSCDRNGLDPPDLALSAEELLAEGGSAGLDLASQRTEAGQESIFERASGEVKAASSQMLGAALLPSAAAAVEEQAQQQRHAVKDSAEAEAEAVEAVEADEKAFLSFAVVYTLPM